MFISKNTLIHMHFETKQNRESAVDMPWQVH